MGDSEREKTILQYTDIHMTSLALYCPHTTNNREGLYIAATARILCAEYFDHLCMISCHGIACVRTIFHLVLLIRLTQV